MIAGRAVRNIINKYFFNGLTQPKRRLSRCRLQGTIEEVFFLNGLPHITREQSAVDKPSFTIEYVYNKTPSQKGAPYAFPGTRSRVEK